jgi:hypothetical protein
MKVLQRAQKFGSIETTTVLVELALSLKVIEQFATVNCLIEAVGIRPGRQ